MTSPDSAAVAELDSERLSYMPREAARLLGVDVRTVYRLIASGRLAATRPSSKLTLISRQALYDFLGVDQACVPIETVAQ